MVNDKLIDGWTEVSLTNFSSKDLEVSCNVFSFRFPFLIIQYASSRRLSEGEDLDFDEIDG